MTSDNRFMLLLIVALLCISPVIATTRWIDTMEVGTAFGNNWTRGNYTCTYGGSNYAGNTSSCALLYNASLTPSIPTGGIQPADYQSYELYNGSMHVSVRNTSPISSGGQYWWGFTQTGQTCVTTGRGVCMTVDPSTGTYRYNVGGSTITTGVTPSWNAWDLMRLQIINSSIQVWINGVNTNNDTLANSNSAKSNASVITNTSGVAQYFPLFDNWQVCQGNCDNPTQSANQVFTINVYDAVNNTMINGFCVNITSTNTTAPTQYLCNTTGNTISSTTTFESGNVTFVNITGGHALPTYFNASLLNQNFTSTKTITTNTSQVRISLQAYRLFLNTSVATFNATNNVFRNTTTSSMVLVWARNASNNIKVDVPGNYSKNGTCTSATPINSMSCNITGIYDTVLTVQADIGGSPVTNFTVNVTNTTLGTPYLYQQSTTNGSITFALLQGYYYTLTFSSSEFTTEQVSMLLNENVEAYNFSVSLSRSLNLTIRDEITRSIINETFTIEVNGEDNSTNKSTSNGTIFFQIDTAGFYTIRYRSNNYPERDYYVNITPTSTNSITLYALNFSESDDVIALVEDTAGDAVEGAIVKLLRFYNYCNCYEIVEMSQTSYAGQAYFNAQYYEGHYKWAVDYQNINYFTSTSPENFIPTTSGAIVQRIFTINLQDDAYSSYTDLLSVGAACMYNSTSHALSFTWNNPSGTSITGCLEVTYLSGVRMVSYQENCQESSSGSVIITLNNTNTTRYQYAASLTIDDNNYPVPACSAWVENSTDSSLGGTAGTYVAFIAGIFILLLAIIFSYSATLMLLADVIGIILIAVSGMIGIEWVFVTGLSFTVGLIAFYLVRT